MFVTVYQTNPDISTPYYRISTKAVQHFCQTALLFRLSLNRLHTRDILLQPQEIRFIEMPRHGNVQHDFYRTAFLPLEIDLSHGDFFLLQPVVQTHKVAFPSVRPTTPPRCTKITPAPRKPIPAAMLAATRETSTETPAAPTIGRKPYEETSVISAAPSETIMCVREPAPFMRVCRSTPISRPQTAAPNRLFEYFPAYASPSRIKTIAQTTDTASPERSVCRYHPLQAYHIPSRKHGTPSGPRFPPET